jgi:hypothetical protein
MIKHAFDVLRSNGFIARPGWQPEGDISEILVGRAAALRAKGARIDGAVFFTKEDASNRTSGGAYPIHFGSVPTPDGKPRGMTNEAVGTKVLESLRKFGVWAEWSGKPDEPIIVKEN